MKTYLNLHSISLIESTLFVSRKPETTDYVLMFRGDHQALVDGGA